MKRFIQYFSLLSLAAGIFAGSVSAQSSVSVVAEIPFDFSIGQKTFPAGTYELSILKNSAGGAAVAVIDSNGNRLESVVGTLNSSSSTAQTKLVFSRDGGRRHLSEIVTGGYGVRIPAAGEPKSSASAINDTGVIDLLFEHAA